MQLKVCGMTDMDQVYQLEDLGVSYAGFIFYAPSPRHVGRRGLQGSDVKRARLKVIKIGVFVDASYDEVMRQIDLFGLDMVQLHGRETPYECARIASYIDVIKAFRFAENDHVQWMIKDYYEDSDMFLFDTGVPAPKEQRNDKTLYGGTGRRFDWRRLKGLEVGKRFFLSGGIEATDAAQVKAFMQQPVARDLCAVDISSRFEILPGIKDMNKIRTFMEELR
jgi:phosphoribosylanthranilate isomerase